MDLTSPITTTAEEARLEGVHNAASVLGVNGSSDKQETAVAWLEHLSDRPAQQRSRHRGRVAALAILAAYGVARIPGWRGWAIHGFLVLGIPLFTGVLVASTPLVVAYVFLQRYFVAGLTAGSVRG